MSTFVEHWDKSSQKGRLKYSLQKALIFAVVVILFKNGTLFIHWVQGEEIEIDFQSILINFSWILLGAILGYYFLIWWWKEKIYQKEKKNDSIK